MIRSLISLLLITGCFDEYSPLKQKDLYGCTDNIACNYNLDATKDNESCIYPQGCNEWCDGDTTLVQIKGQVFTIFDALEFDECGICGGDGSSCSTDD